jgi:hypothetical protein
MLAINSGRVVSGARLVEYAWGYDGSDTSLLKTHVCHIRQKLGLVKGEITAVPGVGYRLSQRQGPGEGGEDDEGDGGDEGDGEAGERGAADERSGRPVVAAAEVGASRRVPVAAGTVARGSGA